MPRSIRFVSLAVALTTSVATLTLASQQVAPLSSGVRIRVTLSTSPETLLGTVDALGGDTLHMQMTDGIRHIPLAAVTTLEVSHGRHGHAALGALVGAGALGLVGLASGDDPPDQWFAMAAGTKAAYGAAFGAGIGALVGWLVRSDTWEPMSLSRVRVAPVALNRVGVSVSLRF